MSTKTFHDFLKIFHAIFHIKVIVDFIVKKYSLYQIFFRSCDHRPVPPCNLLPPSLLQRLTGSNPPIPSIGYCCIFLMAPPAVSKPMSFPPSDYLLLIMPYNSKARIPSSAHRTYFPKGPDFEGSHMLYVICYCGCVDMKPSPLQFPKFSKPEKLNLKSQASFYTDNPLCN